jgi:hypothetical protein
MCHEKNPSGTDFIGMILIVLAMFFFIRWASSMLQSH